MTEINKSMFSGKKSNGILKKGKVMKLALSLSLDDDNVVTRIDDNILLIE